MIVRQKVLSGEMPSKIIAELRAGGAHWQESTREFILSFPETGTSILYEVRTLGLGLYRSEQGSLDILDFQILTQMKAAGLPVTLPPDPVGCGE